MTAAPAYDPPLSYYIDGATVRACVTIAAHPAPSLAERMALGAYEDACVDAAFRLHGDPDANYYKDDDFAAVAQVAFQARRQAFLEAELEQRQTLHDALNEATAEPSHHPDCPARYFLDKPERCRCEFMVLIDQLRAEG